MLQRYKEIIKYDNFKCKILEYLAFLCFPLYQIGIQPFLNPKIIDLLCTNFGETHTYEGNVYYSFPSPDRIAQLGADELSVIRAGFREKYILKCAKMVCNGEFDLDGLRHLSTADAKKKLMSLPGIGNKVSDCILLFALNRFDSFPIDVWIKRIMEYCYFNSKEQSIDTIARFAADKFGNLGGIAQQYLFYYARGLKIGT